MQKLVRVLVSLFILPLLFPSLLLVSPVHAASAALPAQKTATPGSKATAPAKHPTPVGSTAGTKTAPKAGALALPSQPPISRLGEVAFYPLLEYRLTDRLHLHVNLANGNLIVHATDLAIRGTGLNLVVDRVYNSLAATTLGSFGNGWTASVGADVQLPINGNTVTFAGPSGYRVRLHPEWEHLHGAAGG